ncbi:MAG: cyclic nucleotide-binding domain-containing protein [Actinobacteria bacterium]|nr:MAG: cyclic nucleotide-binding domain-containing protein [Actinomycetota bacterium]
MYSKYVAGTLGARALVGRLPWRSARTGQGRGRAAGGERDDLGAVERLAALPGPVLRALDSAGDRCAVWPGYVVVDRGAPVHWVWIVLDGELAVDGDGRPERVLRRGDVLGVVETVARVRSATRVVARDRTALLAIPERQFTALVDTQAPFAGMVLRAVARAQAGERAGPALSDG